MGQRRVGQRSSLSSPGETKRLGRGRATAGKHGGMKRTMLILLSFFVLFVFFGGVAVFRGAGRWLSREDKLSKAARFSF
jgi:TRAP-type uncharacterized transport system fused permease subunit